MFKEIGIIKQLEAGNEGVNMTGEIDGQSRTNRSLTPKEFKNLKKIWKENEKGESNAKQVYLDDLE